MSNKLYTEESIKQSLLRHRNQSFFMNINQIDYLISELTPIELPTDKEIEEEASKVGKKCSATIYEESAYVIGAIWMRDKIQGGNNEPK